MTITDPPPKDLIKRPPKSKKFNDLSGQRFGRLVVVELAGWSTHYSVWKCKCDCGSTVYRRCNRFSKSNEGEKMCLECRNNLKITHGMSNTPQYARYSRMKAEGATWKTFQEYYTEVGDVPFRHNIDPIDPSKPIGPGNWKYGNKIRLYTVNGVTKPMSGWGEFLGVTRERARQLANKGNLERRVREAFREKKQLAAGENGEKP